MDNSSEDSKFTETVRSIFSKPPYTHDPRKEMMFNHLISGRASSYQRLKQLLAHFSKPVDEMTVLDAGCGSGMGCAALSDLGCKTIIGFDPGKEAIGLPIAAKRYYAPESSVSFIQASGYEIPLADNSIDFCWCSFVIEHIPDPLQFFAEIYRVLAPKSLCYISTNNRLWPIEPHSRTWFASWLPSDMAEKYVRWRKRWPTEVDWDVYLPTYWQMSYWADQVGFDIIKSTRQMVKVKLPGWAKRVNVLKRIEFLLPNLYLLLEKPAEIGSVRTQKLNEDLEMTLE